MDELTTAVGSTGQMDRREALRRGAFVVGAATLWATPVVQTLGMRPAAAASPKGDSEFCLDVVDSDQPSNMVYRYDPARLAANATNQQGSTASGNYTWSQDDPLNPDAQACVRWDRTGSGPQSSGFAKVSDGDFVLVPGKAGSQVTVTITDACGNVQRFAFHTSCSDLWERNDQFGSLTTVGGQADGGSHVGVPVTSADVTVDFSAGGCGTLDDSPCADPESTDVEDGSSGLQTQQQDLTSDGVEGGAVEGGAVEGGAVEGGAVEGGAVEGGAVEGAELPTEPVEQ